MITKTGHRGAPLRNTGVTVALECGLLDDLSRSNRYAAGFITNAARSLVSIEKIWWNYKEIVSPGVNEKRNGMLDELRKDVYEK